MVWWPVGRRKPREGACQRQNASSNEASRSEQLSTPRRANTEDGTKDQLLHNVAFSMKLSMNGADLKKGAVMPDAQDSCSCSL